MGDCAQGKDVSTTLPLRAMFRTSTHPQGCSILCSNPMTRAIPVSRCRLTEEEVDYRLTSTISNFVLAMHSFSAMAT